MKRTKEANTFRLIAAGAVTVFVLFSFLYLNRPERQGSPAALETAVLSAEKGDAQGYNPGTAAKALNELKAENGVAQATKQASATGDAEEVNVPPVEENTSIARVTDGDTGRTITEIDPNDNPYERMREHYASMTPEELAEKREESLKVYFQATNDAMVISNDIAKKVRAGADPNEVLRQVTEDRVMPEGGLVDDTPLENR